MEENTNRVKILIVLTVILIIFLFSVIFSLVNINNTKIFRWISISGINVSDMTKSEAKNIVSKIIDSKEKSIKIKIGDFETETTFENLGVKYNIDSYIDQAYGMGRSGNIFTNNFTILGLILKNKNI